MPLDLSKLEDILLEFERRSYEGLEAERKARLADRIELRPDIVCDVCHLVRWDNMASDYYKTLIYRLVVHSLKENQEMKWYSVTVAIFAYTKCVMASQKFQRVETITNQLCLFH